MSDSKSVLLVVGTVVETLGRGPVDEIKRNEKGVLRTHRVPSRRLYQDNDHFAAACEGRRAGERNAGLSQEKAGQYVEELLDKLAAPVGVVAVLERDLQTLRDSSACPHHVVKFLYIEYPDLMLYAIATERGWKVKKYDIRVALGISK